MTSRLRSIAALVVASTLAVGCGSSGGASSAPAGSSPASAAANGGASASVTAAAPLTVYGAASLSGALGKLKTGWEQAHPGSALTISTDSSAALETQIEQGAPADVFLSADTTNPRKLADAALADGPIVEFAGNALTIVVPADNPAKISVPADLARSGVKIVAAGDDVPITKYAKQLVANVAKTTPGFDAGYAANIVSKEDNVKAIVAKIELGEGDAAIVYGTDARASTKVATVAVPPDANVSATYAGVVVKASAHPTDALAFLAWVAGPDGQAILASFGFLPPPD